jgi:SagB-type dehydrogenase family enzyme
VPPACSLATLVPHSRYFEDVEVAFGPDEIFRTSRFAFIRHETELVLSSPRAYAHLVLASSEALLLYHRLCQGASAARLTTELEGKIPQTEIVAFLRLAIACRIVERVQQESGLKEEDRAIPLRQWEFHDLLLQAESRMGRCSRMIGGTHRFSRELEQPPAVKERPWRDTIIPLRTPAADDPFRQVTLEQALAARKTSREQGESPITLGQLGDFLHRTARILSLENGRWPREYPYGGDFTRRPYPNGGARYELELYVTVDRCDGLARGFYHHDPLHHRLALVAEPNPDMEQQLVFSALASGGCHTQILLTVASRFARSSWKYQGMALALQLKNVGVLLAHFYLVAAGMGLASCALGVGDSDLFSRLAGLDYLEESSIGEFQLGSRSTDERG